LNLPKHGIRLFGLTGSFRLIESSELAEPSGLTGSSTSSESL